MQCWGEIDGWEVYAWRGEASGRVVVMAVDHEGEKHYTSTATAEGIEAAARWLIGGVKARD